MSSKISTCTYAYERQCKYGHVASIDRLSIIQSAIESNPLGLYVGPVTYYVDRLLRPRMSLSGLNENMACMSIRREIG